MIWIIPIIFLALSILLRLTAGPFWLGLNNDPAYLYLMNSLYLADGKIPTFIQHPGTPLQMIGASIIKVLSGFKQGDALVEAVFKSPELYVHAIWLTLIVLATMATYAVGRFMESRFKQTVPAVLVQSGVLLLGLMYPTIGAFLTLTANVAAETFLISLTLIFVGVVFKDYADHTVNDKRINAVILGIILGVMLAVKVTMVPFIIGAMIVIKTWRYRVLCLGVLSSVAVLATYSIWPQYPGIYNYLKSMMMYGGAHGSGNVGFLDPQAYRSGLGLVVQWAWPILVTVFISMFQVVRRRQCAENRPIIALSVISVLTCLMVGKEPIQHYVAPALLLTGALLALLVLSGWGRVQLWLRGIFLAIVMMTGVTIAFSFNFFKDSTQMTNFSTKVYQDYASCTIAGFYRSSSVEFALQFGDENAGRREYGTMIQKLYPQHYFVQLWQMRLDDSVNEVFAQDIVAKSQCLMLYGGLSESAKFKPPLYQLESVASVGTEGLFRVTQAFDRDAKQVLILSMMAYQKGDLQTSYGLATKAKEYGSPQAQQVLNSIENIIKEYRFKAQQ